MKKVIIALVVLTLGAFSCAMPEGPGYNGSDVSGARLYISDVDTGGWITNLTDPDAFDDMPAMASIAFMNEPVNPRIDRDDPAITILNYDVEYFSEDPFAVPLRSHYGLPLTVELQPFDEVKLDNIPVVFAETLSQYMATGDPTRSVGYRCKCTFHGQTEYGYGVQTFFNYLWIINGPI